MSNYKDLDKRRAAQRAYYAKTKEAKREETRKYHREYRKRRRAEDPVQRQKECDLRKEYYYKNQEAEKTKSREYMRLYHQKNKVLSSEKGKAKYKAAVEKMNQYLSERCCEICGFNDIDCLQFHHPMPKGRVNGKRVEPTIKTMLTHSWKRVMEEVAKCVLLCANCHTKEHAKLRREAKL